METWLKQIREQQKQSWNKFSQGWKKWDTFNIAFLQLMGEAIISNLDIHDSDHVLDIAAGTGEQVQMSVPLARSKLKQQNNSGRKTVMTVRC